MPRARTRSPIPIPGIRHGVGASYRNHGCGCDPCRDAAQREKVEVMRRRLERATYDETGRPVLRGIHGTLSLYTSGCRCAPCTSENARYGRERYRAGRQ